MDSGMLPKIEDFLLFTDQQIVDVSKKYGIKTVYLPIDGTRRYFISKTMIDQSNTNFFEKYLDFVRVKTIELMKKFYDYGVLNLIVLLMDDTSFNRGDKYLNHVIKHGIEPITEHPSFLQFYKEYKVNVFFGGTMFKYQDMGFNSLIEKFQELSIKTRQDSYRTLTYFTGTSNSFDYLHLLKRYSEIMRSTNDFYISTSKLKSQIITDLYNHNLPPIDLSFYYGYPRDKITPPMLTDNSVYFYSKNPTLSLSRNQIMKGIYLTVLSKNSLKDTYKEYLKIDREVEELNILDDTLMGEDFYFIL